MANRILPAYVKVSGLPMWAKILIVVITFLLIAVVCTLIAILIIILGQQNQRPDPQNWLKRGAVTRAASTEHVVYNNQNRKKTLDKF